MIDRSPEYWRRLSDQAENVVGSLSRQIAASGVLGNLRVRYSNTLDQKHVSPSISIVDGGLVIDFPLHFFVWLDEAAKFMHGDAPFRRSIALTQHFPGQDFSALIHLYWSMWVANHEISHFLCGHLAYLSIAKLDEFHVVSGGTDSESNRFLREAMEVDADVNAARMFFGAFGRLSRKGDLADLYRVADGSVFAMQDLALIFLPLFMEIDYAGVSDPVRRIHPSAMHRLMIFWMFGMEAYRDAFGEGAEEHIAAFGAGLRRATGALFDLDSSMLRKPIENPSFALHRSRLLEVQMNRLRVVDLSRDWLLRGCSEES
jgi:hypothetical protein